MTMINTRFLVYFVVAILWLVLSSHLIRVEAKKHKKKTKSAPTPTQPPSSQSHPAVPSNSKTFNVVSYGAKGYGSSDDTQPFLAAWKDACAVADSVLLVPGGSFLIMPVTFDGPCNGLTFQVDGTLIAPTSSSAWSKKPLEWLNFEKVVRITIVGAGKIDGQGAVWWPKSNNMPSTKPTAMRFGGCNAVIVTGISIVDSQQAHLKFDGCRGVEVHHITINSPGDSPNTDGIHIQGSKNVNIHDVKVSCGDDCISIQTGSSGINIEGVACGPSHGISIGSLGQNGATACVYGVTVSNCAITDSDNGLRIKSLPNGRGTVRGVSFTNIQVTNVKSAITIDQHYGCNDGGSCVESSVSVSDISFTKVTGTYTLYPADIMCGQSAPCTAITLSQIELRPTSTGNEVAFCQHASGTVEASGTAVAHCLNSESPKSSYDQYYFLDDEADGGSC